MLYRERRLTLAPVAMKLPVALIGIMSLFAPIPAQMVTTEDGFVAALAAPAVANVVLGANIALNKSVEVNGTKGLTLYGQGNALDGQGRVQCLSISGGADVTVVNLTVTNGVSASGGGGMLVSESKVTIISSLISHCQAGDNGGALFVLNGNVTAHGSAFVGNMAAADGGAVLLDGGTLLVESSVFAKNWAGYNGGAVSVQSSHVNLVSCNFSNNYASSHGGGIKAIGGKLFVKSSVFTENQAGYGGAVYVQRVYAKLVHCNVTSNAASYLGGGVEANSGTLFLESSVFTKNQAGSDVGGAVFMQALAEMSSHIELVHCSVSSNFGGGVYVVGNLNVVLYDCAIFTNTVNGIGGGLYITGYDGFSPMARVTNTTIHNNTATLGGGGIIVGSSILFLSESFIVSNTASSFGGGMSIGEGSKATLTNTSILNNVALAGGGGGISITDDSELNATGIVVHSNKAVRSPGGGIYAKGVSRIQVKKSTISANKASWEDLFVDAFGSSCSSISDCFYSPNFPNNYDSNDICNMTVLQGAKLEVQSFSTELNYDFLYINGEAYSGSDGPDGVRVRAGDVIRFTSDDNTVKSGFQICASVTSDGGGVYLEESPEVIFEETLIENNLAASCGDEVYVIGSTLSFTRSVLSGNRAYDEAELDYNELYIDSSKVAMVGSEIRAALNSSTGQSSVYLNSGSLDAINLHFNGLFGGAFAETGITCKSACLRGEYDSSCSEATGAPNCVVNCGACSMCPEGTANAEIGATDFSACSKCPTGLASTRKGSKECASCEIGKYASNSSFDQSGGLVDQVLLGASSCNRCPVGTFTSSKSTIVCQVCPFGRSSYTGASSCDLAAPGYYLLPPELSAVSVCPKNAFCEGGDKLPRPSKGFWVGRKNIIFADRIYKCARETCMGASPGMLKRDTGNFTNSTCWSTSFYSLPDSERLEACGNAAELVCEQGADSALCGSCKSGYVYASSTNSCIKCKNALVTDGIILGTALALAMLALALRNGLVVLPRCIENSWVAGIARQVDSGSVRTMIITYQIVASVSVTLGVTFPAPFPLFLEALSIFSFDWISAECLTGSYYTFVLFWSIGPIFLSLLVLLVFTLRACLASDRAARKIIKREHLYVFIAITFLVLPTVTSHLFKALDCIDVNGANVLRVDTSIDCLSPRYTTFKVADVAFVALYLGVPTFWAVMLWRKRDRLNPKSGDVAKTLAEARTSGGTVPLLFLFEIYKPRLVTSSVPVHNLLKL